MSRAATILVVDDEADIASTLAYNLEREGYEVHTAGAGKQALETVDRVPHLDLVILDLMLPDMSGLEVCRQLRKRPKGEGLHVLMLTARGEEFDRVTGFEVGADDYVAKPFSTRELLLRIKAILRRRGQGERTGEEKAGGEAATRFGRLKLDEAAHRVWVDDQETRLTALEFRLLTTFLSRKGRVQSRDTLLNDVWGIDAEVTTRTVDTHVKRLREKLGAAGDYVETLRGVGYRFKAHPDESS